MPERCRHGNHSSCHECLKRELTVLKRLLEDPEAAAVCSKLENYRNLKRQVRMAIEAVDAMERNDLSNNPDWSDDASFHSVMDVSSEVNQKPVVKPKVVAASGFGARPKMPPKQRDRSISDSPERERSVGVLASPPHANRMRWTEAEIEDLRKGHIELGSDWKAIQQTYPSLQRFSGVQLKDKHRATFGSRASTSTR
jgi:hypothetical protein